MISNLENCETIGDGQRLPAGRLLVEVIGPAGSGKTSLIKALRQRSDRFALCERPRFWRRVLAFIRVITLNPSFLFNVWGLSCDEIRTMIYLRAWYAMYPNGDSQELTLFDHGPLYRIAILREFCTNLSGSRQFQRWLTRWTFCWQRKLDMVILLDAPNDILMERVIDRGEFRVLLTVSAQEAAQMLDAYRSAFKQVLKSEANAYSGPLVLSFDTNAVASDDMILEVLSTLSSSAKRNDSQASHLD